MTSAVTITHLSKRFRVYDRPLDRLKEWLTPRGMSFHWAYWALRDINLTVPRGSALGIVGANGAGKSTLLKILCGTLSPTTGSISVHGRITGMLELGSGFHPEFTGRQNIFLNARLLGLSDAEIHQRLPRILEFAELGEFIDHPLRIFSTGMVLRLGFSIAANVEPDILIIDEALAVGDAYFQHKCIQYLRRFRQRGGTLLFVSHDPGAVKLLCDEAVLLHQGSIIRRGAPDEVLDYYNALIARRTSDDAAFRIEHQHMPSQPPIQHSGTFEALLSRIEILVNNIPTRTVVSGDEVTIEVEATALAHVPDPTVGISLRDRLGYEIFGVNTYTLHHPLDPLDAGDRLVVRFHFPCNIGPGDYSITAAIHSGLDHLTACYDWADRFLAFKVLPASDNYHRGVARLPVHVSSTRARATSTTPHALLESLFGRAPSSIYFDSPTQQWTFGGWYPTELVDNIPVRWTKRDAVFLLTTGASGQILVECATDPALCASHPLDITLFANGLPVHTATLQGPTWQSLVFHLPPDLRGIMARFALRPARTFVPAHVYNTADQRELGIMVRRIVAL
ncbi:MAG: ABC transporter ATP-binding protein [bacterium]|nr:ABC transporter ATP-binding protein [bacterium]